MTELKSKGFHVIIDLNARDPEKRSANAQNLEYHGIYVEDYTAPSVETLKEISELISRKSSLGRRVYMHCSQAYGRSPTCAAAFLLYDHFARTVAEAQNMVRERRKTRKMWAEGSASNKQREALAAFAHEIQTS
jgi:protein-tyrosine phosphatase